MITRKSGSVFDLYQEEVLKRIEIMFPDEELKATRGHSAPLEQLHIIGAYAQGFAYPEFNPQDVHAMSEVELFGAMTTTYCWHRTWGECLHRGIIINPPLAAIAPFDYFRNGQNKKGVLIPASPHIKYIPTREQIEKGEFVPCPIDFSQQVGGVPNIERVAAIMAEAKLKGAPIRNITVEHGNGCVHIDLEKKV